MASKSRILFILSGIGVAVIVAGFGYDIMLAGIPYQDPPPELEASWRFHSRVASAIVQTGGAVVGASVVKIAGMAMWSSIARKRT